MKEKHVNLEIDDKEQLQKMLNKGSLKSRTYKRITALLELDKGRSYVAVQSSVNLSKVSLGKLARNYADNGLGCLYDAPRPGRPIRIDEQQRARLTVLSCSEAPQGHSQWSLRLLADKMVELGHCDSVSHTMVGKILKKEN